MREALLLAIYLGHVQIAETCLRHPKFKVLNDKFTGNDDSFWQTPSSDDAQFAPDITPLILASQYNRTEIGNFLFFLFLLRNLVFVFKFNYFYVVVIE
jgi:hypothetical protein